MKVIILDIVDNLLISKLEDNGVKCEIKNLVAKNDIKKIINRYDGIIIRSRFKIDKDFLDHCTNVKFIARAGSGMENINVKYAESKGIKCFNSEDGNAQAVAEHALSMLLNLFNKISIANNEVKNGIWKREQNRGIELKGKTVGIIGFGNTGSAFARVLKGFDLRILCYDKYLKKYDFQSSMQEIFKYSDIISINIPLNLETQYIVNKDFIKNCNKPFYLINTSRGECVKNNDIVEALKTNKILGACLDVIENEEISFENILSNKEDKNLKYLLESNKTILTPHIAGWTTESTIKISHIISEKILNLKNLYIRN
jgi:D-3-phosphoglycerate dehydrogenase